MLKSSKGKTMVKGSGKEIIADLHVLCADIIYTVCSQTDIKPKEARKVFMDSIREGFDRGEKLLKDEAAGKDVVLEAIKEILADENSEKILREALRMLVEAGEEDADD